jgi:3-hydroxybutyryl-CoA dehydrogenase
MASEYAPTHGSGSIRTVAIVGSGYMGGGIAQVLALSGRDVVLSDVDAARAQASRVRLLEEARRFVAADLFDPGSVEVLEQRLRAADSIESAVADVDYVTEAVFESPEVKGEALQRISRAARPDTVIGTNTSAIPIGELAKSVDGPERFMGVHWMNPAPFVPAIELIPTPHTTEDAIARVTAMLVEAGKAPALVADSPGFVANRLQFALYKEAVRIVDEGLAAEYGDRLAAPERLTQTVAAGNLGIKTGRGFLDSPAEDVPALVAYRDAAYRRLSQLRRELGAAPGLEVAAAREVPQ